MKAIAINKDWWTYQEVTCLDDIGDLLAEEDEEDVYLEAHTAVVAGHEVGVFVRHKGSEEYAEWPSVVVSRPTLMHRRRVGVLSYGPVVVVGELDGVGERICPAPSGPALVVEKPVDREWPYEAMFPEAGA